MGTSTVDPEGLRMRLEEHFTGLKDDIVEVRDKLNGEKIKLQGELEKYNENKKNPDINLDKAAEPLKNETFKFSNYSYVPIVYYPVGCIFLLFLIYKKL